MKKIYLLFFISFLACNSQDKRPLLGDTPYQIKQNNFFKDASTSPLKKKDLKNFKGLDFFPVDSNFIVEADFTPIENSSFLEIPTTTSRIAFYRKYGTATFTINGKEQKLTIYQDQESNMSSATSKDLFLPFTDATSGESSYGGGRYMNLKSGAIKDGKITLNFNNTYNPYCAYNENYSCPIVPRENHLDVAITAGVKKFK